MASNSGGPKRLQKYPVELRERAVRMVLEIRREIGQSHGVIARVARELAYTGRVDEIGARPSIGTVGDSFDNRWPNR